MKCKALLSGLLLTATLMLASKVLANFEVASELYLQKNYTAAYQAFIPLAEAGDPRAQTVLALMNKYGEGVPLNMEAAYNWYLKAAEQGYPPAQFHVGTMLADGQGVEADEQAAIAWLEKASQQGFTRADQKLSELNYNFATTREPDELIAWSQAWNFRLPNEVRANLVDPEMPLPDETFIAQVGAMGTQVAANKLWQILLAQHQDLLGELNPMFRNVEVNGQRYYRVYAGPFEDFKTVNAFCESLLLRPNQAGCLPVRSTALQDYP